MKKLLAILFFVFLIMASTGIPAYAVTPQYTPPAIPKVEIGDVHIEIPDSFWDKYFEEHPITVPEPTEPALGVPEITDAHYTHSRVFYAPSNLKIKWTAVEGAESYEVLITLANGEMITYVETDISVYDTNVKCPQSYSNGNGHVAYVKVRAIAGDVCGEWSAEETISCNAFHFGG